MLCVVSSGILRDRSASRLLRMTSPRSPSNRGIEKEKTMDWFYLLLLAILSFADVPSSTETVRHTAGDAGCARS